MPSPITHNTKIKYHVSFVSYTVNNINFCSLLVPPNCIYSNRKQDILLLQIVVFLWCFHQSPATCSQDNNAHRSFCLVILGIFILAVTTTELSNIWIKFYLETFPPTRVYLGTYFCSTPHNNIQIGFIWRCSFPP